MNSCNSAILFFRCSTVTFISFASDIISSSSDGKNSWSGGSRYLTVIGMPFSSLYIALKSLFWNGINSFNALVLSSDVSERIIFLIFGILSSSKNMCSVLHNPIPSAPNSMAFLVSFGLSAFVLIPSVLYLSAKDIILPKSPLTVASSVFISPLYIFPVFPSIEI